MEVEEVAAAVVAVEVDLVDAAVVVDLEAAAVVTVVEEDSEVDVEETEAEEASVVVADVGAAQTEEATEIVGPGLIKLNTHNECSNKLLHWMRLSGLLTFVLQYTDLYTFYIQMEIFIWRSTSIRFPLANLVKIIHGIHCGHG